MRRFVVLAGVLGVGLILNVAMLVRADSLGGVQSISLEASTDGIRLDRNTTRYRSEGTSVAPLDGGETITAIGSATSANDSSIAGIHSIICVNYAQVQVPLEFSVAGATCVVTAVRGSFNGTTLVTQSIEKQTITADTVYTTSGRYFGTRTADFSTNGCQIMKILFEDPSSGTVTPGCVTVN